MEKTIFHVTPDNFADALRLLHGCAADAAELRFSAGDYYLDEPVTLTSSDPQKNVSYFWKQQV